MSNINKAKIRVLLTAQPGVGHVNPMIELGRNILQLGCDVVLASSAVFAGSVESAGLEFCPIGEPWSEGDVARYFPGFVELSEWERQCWLEQMLWYHSPKSMVSDLYDRAEDLRADLVISNSYDWSGQLFAHRMAIPYAEIAIAARTPGFGYRQLFSAHHAKLLSHFSMTDELTEPVATVQFGPPTWCVDHQAASDGARYFKPLLYDSADRRAWDSIPALPWEKTVVISFGTVSNKNTRLLQTLVGALRGGAYNTVVLAGPGATSALASRPEEGLLVYDYYPLSLALTQADAVITHGGVSTVLAALSRGLPLLVLPIGADQPMNYLACTQMGVAPELPPAMVDEPFPGLIQINEKKLTQAGIQALIETLFQDKTYGTRASEAQAHIDGLPSVAEACQVILESASLSNPV